MEIGEDQTESMEIEQPVKPTKKQQVNESKEERAKPTKKQQVNKSQEEVAKPTKKKIEKVNQSKEENIPIASGFEWDELQVEAVDEESKEKDENEDKKKEIKK